jgi:hypothetical protein
MIVQGRDCLIVLKTQYREIGVPYSEETTVEGNGSCGAIRRSSGVTGCVVTPLTLGTAPLLLSLAMGSVGL